MEMYRERSTDRACCHTPPLDVTMIGPIDKRSVNTSHTIAPVLSAIPHPQQQEVLRRCGWNDVFHCNPPSAKLLKDPHTRGFCSRPPGTPGRAAQNRRYLNV